MTPEQQMEEFSLAYIRAAAAAAGMSASRPDVDDDSIDLTVTRRGPVGEVYSPTLGIQAKCTAKPPADFETRSFRLSRKNYDDLRAVNVMLPRVLVVMFVPSDRSEWLTLRDDATLLRQYAVWSSLRGREGTDQESIAVPLDVTAHFTPAALRAIFERIGRRDPP